MAVVFICDGGCGHSGPKTDFTELGYAKKKIYCKECVESVEDYLKILDQAHTQAAKLFKEVKDQASDAWHHQHSGSLPDE